jgi:hypothetical protein
MLSRFSTILEILSSFFNSAQPFFKIAQSFLDRYSAQPFDKLRSRDRVVGPTAWLDRFVTRDQAARARVLAWGHLRGAWLGRSLGRLGLSDGSLVHHPR